MPLNRRDMLKLSIAAYLATLTAPAYAKKLSGTKVIVVGAGLSGLAAAQRLQAQGAEVVVLEAGDYVGGRVRTDWSLGAPFEYGAGWVHGPSRKNPTQKLARQVGTPTFVTDDDNLEVFDHDGYALSDAQYERMGVLYEDILETLYYPKRPGKRSVREMLERSEPELLRDPLSHWVLSAYMEFSIGAGIEDISAANGFESEAFDGADVIFTQGYDTILEPLADGLDIRLNTPVSEIRHGRNGVKVAGMSADYAICTVPLGVLKTGAVTFDPPLPGSLQKSIAQLGFGTVTKIALKFEEAFWDVETQYFGIMTKPKGRWNYWMNYRTFSDENILLGVSLGRYAPVADRMSKAEMTEDALEVLRGVWEDDVGTPQSVLTTHWSQDPLFYGTYSYAQKGGSIAQFDRFKKPVRKRLLFAGEHTNFKYGGTTHGALMSGRRAADAARRV